MAMRSGRTSRRIVIAAALAFGWLGGTCAVASVREATETVAAMQARDGRVLAREIRSAADRKTHTPNEVKTLTSSFGVHALDVLYRALPGTLSQHGAYVLELITGPHGIEKVAVTEFRSRRRYVFDTNATGEDTYSLDWTPGDIGFTWLSTGTISYTLHATASNQAIMTRARLETFYKQALMVVRKAEQHGPVTREEELHPGIPCGPRAPGEPHCLEPSEGA